MGITEVENTMMRKYNARAVYLLGILLFMIIGVVPPLHALNTEEHLLPGNLLTFSLMGNEAISKDFRIDPHGFIQLPDIAPINCKGQTLKTLKATAIQQLSSSYKNADSLSVSKKSNRFYVNVLGLVAKPGTYLVGPHDGLQIALERAGGMLDGAQMNQLQLHREAKVIIIDYKQYLNTGNLFMLPSLMAMDKIFVPSSKLIGNVKLNNQQLLPQQGDAASFKDSIKIFGAVFKPGAYTYNANFSAIDYLLRAGGTTQYAKTDQIKIIDNATAVAFNLREYLTTAQKSLLPKISLGATIFVPQTSEVAKPGTGTVYVMGQVQHAGSYELGKKTSFMGAVGNAGGPNQYAETRKIRIIHANGKVEYFDMQAFTEGIGHVTLPGLIDGDVIYFPLKTDLNEKSWLDIAPKRSIKIIGAVTRPGRYEWADEMNIMDLISNVGGPTKDADTAHIRIISKDSQTPPVEFNLKNVIEKGIGKEGLPKLKAGYTVSVPEMARAPINLKQAIKLFGEVYKPGAYAYNPKLTAVDYILLAGGITHYASPDQIKIIDNSQSTLFNLKEYLDTATSKNMPVIREGATIFVPVVTNEVKSDSRTIYVIGQVQKPDAYELGKTSTFLDVLANAGGPNHYAETRKIRLIHKVGPIEFFDMQAYTEGLSKAKLPIIRGGDVIYIPIKTDLNEKSWLQIAPDHAVKVIGAVVRPGRYEWSDEMSLIDALAHAGGPNNDADIANIRVITNEHDKTGKITTVRFNLNKFVEHGGDLAVVPVVKAGYTIEIPVLPRSPIDNKAIWTLQDPKTTIYVFGEVGKPGRYNFNENLNFLDILSAADGPTEKADLHDIHVIDRQGVYSQVIHVNLSLYFETGDAELIPKVLPGDAIYIPQKNKDYTETNTKHVIKVLGEVKNPGRYRYASSMTVLDVLAAAGGPTQQALVTKILVVNMGTKLETRSTTFNLLEFSKTGNLNMLPTLREGDVIYVPNNEEDFRKQLTNTLQNMANAAIIIYSLGNLNFLNRVPASSTTTTSTK